MAAVDRLKIVVHGRGGHGGTATARGGPGGGGGPRGHRAADRSSPREVSPVQAAVVTIGSIHGGEAFNVIPDEVTLTGTIRTFDADAAPLDAGADRRASRPASRRACGCRAEVEVRAGNPPVINDPAVAEIARRAAERVVGAERVVAPEPTMGGEDMAVYFERVPGCFVFVGSVQRGARPRPAAPQPALRLRRGRARHRLRVPGRGGRGSAEGLAQPRPRSRGRRWPAPPAATRSRGRCPDRRARRWCRPDATVTGGSTRSSSK